MSLFIRTVLRSSVFARPVVLGASTVRSFVAPRAAHSIPRVLAPAPGATPKYHAFSTSAAVRAVYKPPKPYKLKTHKGAAARFRVNAGGVFRRAHAGKGRKNIKMSVNEPMRITLSDRDPLTHHKVWFQGAESMLSGAGAGLVSSVVMCPLDVIKTKIQASNHGSVSDVVRRIMRSDGFRGFYRGLGPTVVGYLPTWAIYFTVYDRVKSRLEKSRGSDDTLAHIASAMAAGASGTICTNPLWVVKTRFMTQELAPNEKPYRNTFEAMHRIYKAEGISLMYKGILPSLLGVFHVVVQFPLYEHLKYIYRPADGSDIPSSTILMCSSGSKMVASVITYPHEVLRTKLQLNTPNDASLLRAPGDFVRLVKHIYSHDGIQGFYRGMGINLCRTVPNSAITILTYEVLLRQLVAFSK